MHILCTICSDLINQSESIYVTKCGHIFHHHCLIQWIERSKSCPQCRNKVTEKCMFRMYPTISNDVTSGEDSATLQSRLDDTQLQLRQQKSVCRDKEDKISDLIGELKKNEALLKSYEKKLVSRDSAMTAMREQMEYLKIQNKETVKLKEENETMKQNLQLLNGLNNILNATCEDVEKMLQGYTDVKTVAIFATALKRGLCESEAKKRESRDKLHAAKQQIAAEKLNVRDLQAKLLHAEDKLTDMERKYQALAKRKAGDMTEKCVDDKPAHAEAHCLKHMRPSLENVESLNTTNNTSIRTLVDRIENADSPYLSLKQSNLALTALQRAPKHALSLDRIKPSELAIINSARSTVSKKPLDNKSLSIFAKKEPVTLDPDVEMESSQNNICYDGLGGHSKLEIFPVPSNRPLKSCVPKVTPRHRLKRPASSGSQDIGKMIEKLMDK